MNAPSSTAKPQRGAGAVPRLYGDEALVQVQVPQAGRGRSASALVADLLDADDARARVRLVRSALQAIGFEWLAYGTFTLHAGVPTPGTFYTGHAHPPWTERYFGDRLYEIDVRPHTAVASGLPLVWGIDEMEQIGTKRFLVEAMRDCGVGSGVFLSLGPSGRTQERTAISLLSSARRRDWIGDGVLGRALVMALAMHQFLSQHTRLDDDTARTPGTDLSATQQGILDCLLEGHSDKVIAHRLQLSSHVVDYHMRQLRRRFAARNRVQLAHAAMDHATSV